MIEAAITYVNGIVWGPPMLALLLGVGLYLTVRTGFMSVRRIPYAFAELGRGRKPHGEPAEGDVTPFAALMTAMSATVGTGNIAGVAVAISVGGPGALFWMWVTAVVGMATKYAEAVLAVSYREVDKGGRTVGGPMYYIRAGMGRRWGWLAGAFAIFGVLASFGTGNYIQANSVADALRAGPYEVAPWATGACLLLVAAMVILGGVKRIAAVASRLVPGMAGLYLIAGLIVVGANIQAVPAALFEVVRGAFGYDAAVGGFTGAAFWLAMQKGVARGVFSNEAGQGSAPIAHAAAKNDDPVDQGLIAMLGTLIDTLIVCTVTGMAILTTGVLAGGDTGAPLTAAAFNTVLPGGDHVVTFGLILFAFTTILGWSYYGERCAEYLFGEGAILPYRLAYLAMIPAGAMVLYAEDGGVENVIFLVWLFTDTLTGLMAAPNLIALAVLSPFILKLTKGYFGAKAEGRERAFVAAVLAEKPKPGPA